jgi:hypothetical protein
MIATLRDVALSRIRMATAGCWPPMALPGGGEDLEEAAAVFTSLRPRLFGIAFNHTYCAVLHLLEQAFNGSPKMLGVATGTMYALKAQAQDLMRMPDGEGTTAGPTFEYVPPELRR